MTYKILVVDDDKRMNMLFTFFFEKEIENKEYDLIFAYDGDEALEKLKLPENKDIDLVLTDINMPNKDGFELIEDMTKENFTQPIIVISAYDIQEYKNRAFALPIKEYLTKPINFPSLKGIIKTILKEN
jgi:YesN/AraC family two-component response regulator